MDIKIKLPTAEIKAKGLGAEQASNLIEGFFLALVPQVMKAVESVPTGFRKGFIQREEFETKKAKKVKQPIEEEITKKLPIIGSNKSMRHNPFASLADYLPTNEFIEDDIRIKNGVETYKANYNCPNCKAPGKRYIWSTSAYLKCHKCETKILVESAVPGAEGLEQDKDGAYFIARDFYE